MALPNAYSQYSNNKILTASGPELTLMLYEGAIKFCNIAVMAIENDDAEKANNNIIRAERIIAYLRETLDLNYAVAQDFENIYTYINSRLIQANIHKDKEILEEVLEHLRAVRDNWKEVMKAAKKA